MHQSVDLHRFLQQRIQRAAESAAVSVTIRPPRLSARRLHRHTHLHHQGQPVLTESDEAQTSKATPLKSHVLVHMGPLEGRATAQNSASTTYGVAA